MSEMRVVVRREIPEDEEFRRQWNGLVERMEHPEVFYTWEWAQAVARVYGNLQRPLLFAAYREEGLAGIAALAEARGEVSFLSGTTADYCDFVSAPEDREELIGLVMRELRRMGTAELRLASVPADSTSAEVLRKNPAYSVFVRPAYFCAQIPLHSPEEREQVARSARRSSNKARNAFARMGGIAVEHKKRLEEFDSEFPDFARTHVSRFLASGRISHLVRGERRAFMEELAKLLAAQGWLTLSTLKVDGRTIAWHFGFQFAGTWFSYLPTFDTEVRNLHPGPGAYLLCQILQQASQDPETRLVDLGLGDEGYKKQYAKTGRQTLYLTGSRSRVRLIGHICRYRGASLVKRSPGLEKAARNLVARIAAVRGEGIAGWLRSRGLRVARGFSGRTTISFLEWVGKGAVWAGDMRVQPISAKVLGNAAIKYESEDETLQYLLLSAKRLQSRASEGFVLLEGDGTPVCFCWVAAFEGFKMRDLRETLKEPAAGAVLICDEWTPRSQRGHEHGARCAGMVAELMQASGRGGWTFSADGDSISEWERAGFVARFSLVRKRKLFFTSTWRLEFSDSSQAVMDLYPAA